MNSKQLKKLIETVVAKELKKQLPAILEHVSRQQTQSTELNETVTADPFKLAELALAEAREGGGSAVMDGVEFTTPTQKPKRRLSKNPMLNEILNQTTPFNGADREMDKTVNFDSTWAAGGVDGLKAKMDNGVGLNNTASHTAPSAPTSSGMGITTGVASLDRILNRDNSALVAKFNTR